MQIKNQYYDVIFESLYVAVTQQKWHVTERFLLKHFNASVLI